MNEYNYIAIEGNIGAGKTTLAKMIAADYNAKLILETFADNPFLPRFYKNPDKYGFPLELSFLAERYTQLKNELTHQDLFKSFTISDYYVLKSLIFAKVNLEEAEYELYKRLFHIIHSSLPKPDLFVYLYVNTDRLQYNIRKRGRNYEQNIGEDYLNKIHKGYFDFIRQQTEMRTLIIDVSEIDFVRSSSDYKRLKDLLMKEYPLGITRKNL